MEIQIDYSDDDFRGLLDRLDADLRPGLPRDNPALAEKPVGRAPHPAGGDRPALLDASGSPLYWLIRSADPPFDPRALPSRPALHRAALSAAGDAIKSLLP